MNSSQRFLNDSSALTLHEFASNISREEVRFHIKMSERFVIEKPLATEVREAGRQFLDEVLNALNELVESFVSIATLEPSTIQLRMEALREVHDNVRSVWDELVESSFQ
jgi:uncharacterized Fe-S cluster-containing radical SAM superfamily protein